MRYQRKYWEVVTLLKVTKVRVWRSRVEGMVEWGWEEVVLVLVVLVVLVLVVGALVGCVEELLGLEIVQGRAQASGMRTTERRSCGMKAKDV